MARFRRRRSIGRRVYARARSAFRPRVRNRRSSGGSNPLMSVIVPAFAYGAIRQTAKNYAAPITNMLPLGNNSDEVVFGLAGYLLLKNTSGFMHDFGKAMLTVEAASLGNNIVNPMLSGVTASSGNNVIYGV